MGARHGMSCGKSGVIERYIYRSIDRLYMIVFMKTKRTPAQRRKEFETFARQLASIDWISEGYVQNRGPGAGGPRFQWTRKVRGKTVSVALSEIQFEASQTNATIKSRRNLYTVTWNHPPQVSKQESFRSYLSAIPATGAFLVCSD